MSQYTTTTACTDDADKPPPVEEPTSGPWELVAVSVISDPNNHEFIQFYWTWRRVT